MGFTRTERKQDLFKEKFALENEKPSLDGYLLYYILRVLWNKSAFHVHSTAFTSDYHKICKTFVYLLTKEIVIYVFNICLALYCIETFSCFGLSVY